MIVTVHYLDNEFVAYDEEGNKITNREILEQISFEPFPGYKGVIHLKIPDQPTQETVPLNIKINLDKP